MASQMFGWELVYRLVEKDITKKEDVLVALIHWCFIKYGFKCIGLGDSVSYEVELITESCRFSCQ
jgi:proteasome inhibitor subunit 1 (PI31)